MDETNRNIKYKENERIGRLRIRKAKRNIKRTHKTAKNTKGEWPKKRRICKQYYSIVAEPDVLPPFGR